MKPGRELDALVAEKVMGEKYSHTIGCPMSEFGEFCEVCSGPLPYSTSIEAAWKVVDELFKKHITLQLHQSPGSNYKATMFLNAQNSIGDWFEKERAVGIADTAPHAICLAALRAVGVKID